MPMLYDLIGAGWNIGILPYGDRYKVRCGIYFRRLDVDFPEVEPRSGTQDLAPAPRRVVQPTPWDDGGAAAPQGSLGVHI